MARRRQEARDQRESQSQDFDLSQDAQNYAEMEKSIHEQ